MQRLLALSSPDEWSSHCVPRHLDRAQLVRNTAGVLDALKTPVRCLEPIVLLGKGTSREYKLCIVTESHVYITDLGSRKPPPPPLKFSDMVSAKILAGVADFFLDHAVAVHSQHVILEFQHQYVEMFTFEPMSKLFYHVHSAWLTTLTRLVSRAPPTSHIGNPGYMGRYLTDMTRALEAQYSLVERRGMLEEMSGVARQSVELKTAFFHDMRLLSVLLRDLYLYREDAGTPYGRVTELKYVVAVLTVLGSFFFNSQQIEERVRILTQAPFEFDHVLSLIVADFCAKELREDDSDDDEDDSDDEAFMERLRSGYLEEPRQWNVRRNSERTSAQLAQFANLDNDICDAQVALLLQLDDVIQMAALDINKVEETLGERMARCSDFPVRVRGWVTRVVGDIEVAGESLRARLLAAEALERRRARAERAKAKAREARERTAYRERPAGKEADDGGSSSLRSRLLGRTTRASQMALPSSASSSSSSGDAPRRSILGRLLCRKPAAAALAEKGGGKEEEAEDDEWRKARARRVLGGSSSSDSDSDSDSAGSSGHGSEAAEDYDSEDEDEDEDEVEARAYRETKQQRHENRTCLLRIFQYVHLLHEMLLGSFAVRDIIKDECDEEVRYFLTNAQYLRKIDDDVILGYMARRELQGIRDQLYPSTKKGAIAYNHKG